MNYDDFNEFLKTKKDYGVNYGFDPVFISDYLFGFQEFLVSWAIKKGRAAIFADCGMGKSLMELVFGHNVVMKTNKPVLLLTPLAVGEQMLEEANKFEIEANILNRGDYPKKLINITNYERLHYFNSDDYGGIICDESSILKNFKGTRKSQITEFMRKIPYRLLGTATAAPNDWAELGTSSEALGYLGYMDMIGEFFTNKQNSAALLSGRFFRQEKWNLRSWAAQGPFWQWVASWSRAIKKPSDLGYDDNGFILPELIQNETLINARNPKEGMLFDIPAVGFHETREVKRRTLQERCEAAAQKVSQHDISMVWCNLNSESSLLHKLIPNSIEIKGSDSEQKKVEAARWFCKGKESKRVLISKPSIFGFGLNFQHCNHMTYFPTYSYEQYYQATRRLWRFGQTKPVTVDHIYTEGGKRMMEAVHTKSENADKMFVMLVKYMNDAITVENEYKNRTVEVPKWLT